MATGAVPISINATVDIGHGRGRLAPNPAASLRRIDGQLGRLADVNDAWRSPEVADENRRKWIAYQNGGPVAPYALDRWGSIHCRGYAVDSDDWYDGNAAAIWRRNGWRQTAMYPVGDSRREPWHGEYDEALDEYFGSPAGGGAVGFPTGGSDVAYADDAGLQARLAQIVEWEGLQFASIHGRLNQIVTWQDAKFSSLSAAIEALGGKVEAVDEAVWATPAAHPLAKDADGNPIPVAAIEFLRFDPAEAEQTRRAIAEFDKKLAAIVKALPAAPKA